MTQTARRRHPEVHEVDLVITGMTCASCSARIEKKLGRLDGVDAVVNLATEKATVRYAEPVTVEDLLTTVRATGYGAEVVAPVAPDSHESHEVATEEALKRRALVAAVLTVPVVVLAMVPGLHLDGAPWVQLVLATPVVLWARLAVPPGRRRQRPPRRLDHGHPRVDRRAHGLSGRPPSCSPVARRDGSMDAADAGGTTDI